MEKNIPNPQEKNTKAGRLREASRTLQTLPLDRRPTPDEWESATGELTGDDLDHLKKLAAGYRDRALDPEAIQGEVVREAAAAVLLWPQDETWARECLEAFRRQAWPGPEAEALYAALTKRLGKRTRGRKRPWVMPVLMAAIGVPALLGALYVLGVGWSRSSGLSPIQGPRTLEASFDTQGVKANIQVAQSRMLLFPDATVAELSAWVTFPDHRVEVWEGQVSVLDAQGQPLTRRDVTWRASSDGPLEPGQGVALFEQFDAYPFYDRVTSFQVTTTRILAKEASPQNRREMPVQGIEGLTAGYGLRVWLLEDGWSDRFASRVHTASLEVENSGLKPFTELQFALIWLDDRGKVLKTLLYRPVSPFRTALPSGGRLPWVQESVFDTEVFAWAPGNEPHPVLELRQWQ